MIFMKTYPLFLAHVQLELVVIDTFLEPFPFNEWWKLEPGKWRALVTKSSSSQVGENGITK